MEVHFVCLVSCNIVGWGYSHIQAEAVSLLCFFVFSKTQEFLLWLLVLQDDDAINAEAFINKASFLVSNSQNEVLNWTYKVIILLWGCVEVLKFSICAEHFVFCIHPYCQVCYARILDLKRKFLEAALRYYDISQIQKRQIGDEYVPE